MLYFFYFSAILSSIFMVGSVNPINAVLFLIMVFISVAMIFLLCNLEFLALIFIIVYVGAIAVLFLFIVMMINVKKIEKDNSMYLTVGLVVVLLFAFQMVLFIFNSIFEFSVLDLDNIFMYIELNNLDEVNRLSSLSNIGIVLFLVRPFLVYLAGLILLIAMIGAIYLTNVKRGFSMKKQFNQLSKNYKIHHVNFY